VALTSRRSSAGFWSSSRAFHLPAGQLIEPDGVAGYPIDMRVKAESAQWPRQDLVAAEALHVRCTQYALGCLERWLSGEGSQWLDAARKAGAHLASVQRASGAFEHTAPLAHTFRLRPPWSSAITQGQAASLFVRLHLHTGEKAFADVARRALEPLWTAQAEGGVRGELAGVAWPEEYPTEPQSHVLNGAIFALWGMRDVAVGLGDEHARQQFERGVDALAANLHRYDTGYWSLYSLYPHPIRNRASSFYHDLHINQLEVMERLSPRPEFESTRERWRSYAESASCRARAFGWKAAFRLTTPRNRLLAKRLRVGRVDDA
jgi:hypothetical protein